MSQTPAQPPRRAVPRLFRRQNSFAGFPSATLSIFNNNNNNNNANNNNGRNASKAVLPPVTSAASGTPDGGPPVSGVSTTVAPVTGTFIPGVPTCGVATCTAAVCVAGALVAPPTTAHASMPVYQPPPAASRPVSGFYSLPRHNRPGHLSRALGVGFHLLARTSPAGSSGPTAAEQLGINSPSLPKSHRRNLSEGSTGEPVTTLPITLGSLSRGKGVTKEATLQTISSGGEPKLKSTTKRSGRDGESKPRRRDQDYQSLPRRSTKDQPAKRSPKDGDSKSQSAAKRHDTEPKFRSLPRRHEGEARYQAVSRKSEGDPKYQSLPKRQSTEPRYQTFPKRRDGESSYSHHPSSPKRRSMDPGQQLSSPKKRDVGPTALPSSPKRRDMGPGLLPGSPKRRDTESGAQQSLSPKRRGADPKFLPPPPKKYDIDPKYEQLPPKRPEVDLKYQTFPQKRHDQVSRYQSVQPRVYDIDPKYQALPPKRPEIDLRYYPLPPPRYEAEPKYQTVPPKRRDIDQRYPTVPPKKFGIDVKYQPIPPPKRYDVGPRYQTIPPKRHDIDHRYHYIPPPRPDIDPRYQQLPPRRPDLDPKYQQLPPKRPDIEPKYQQLPSRRPDIEPKYQHLPPRRPDIEPRYQHLPPRPDIEPKYQPLPPRPDIEPKYTQLPPRRLDVDSRYQPIPPRPDIEPRYQSLPPRPDVEPKYQSLPPRPDIEPKYQPLPPRPDIEPKYHPLPPRPDIEPKYQPLPPRPDIEPKYQQLPPRRQDGEPKYQVLPPRHPNGEPKYQSSPPDSELRYQHQQRRPDIEPKYHPMPQRPDIEPKYQQLPLRRLDGESKYHPLPPRRSEGDPKYQALPPRRSDVDPKYQVLPLRRPEADPKYQPLPPRRPEVDPKYQPLPPRRTDIDPKYQPLPPRRSEGDAKYQPIPPKRTDGDAKYQALPPRRPEGESKYQPLPAKMADYEFHPIPIHLDSEHKFQPPFPMFDYEFQPIPTIKPNYEQVYPSMPLRKPDGESRPLPPLSGDVQGISSQPKVQPLSPRTQTSDVPYQAAPPAPVATDQAIPPKAYQGNEVYLPHAPKTPGSIPLYETIPAKHPGTEPIPAKVPGVIPLYEGIPPKIKMPDLPYQSIAPKVSEIDTLYQTMPSPMSPLKADEAEPLYQTSPPKMSASEPLYQSSPDGLESDPVYQAVTPQMIQDVKCNYQLLQQRKLEQEAKALAGPKRTIKGDKYHSPTKRTFRERDGESKSQSSKKSSKGEPKYQSLPKRREKDNDGKYQSLPRRGGRRDPPAPPQFRWTPGDDDGIYSSLEYPSEEGRSGGPSEDEIYSSLTTTDDPVYQSVSEASYSRPVPPLPAPLRYRRRVDDAPPPLPPPRLTTGPVGPHNPLVSPGTVVSPPVLPIRAPRVSSTSNVRMLYPGGSSTSPSPSPENLLTQSAPSWPQRQHRHDNEEVYSSIPSLISSTPESPPATLPRAAQIGRVAPSASWNSLGSSCRSSWDSLGSSVRSEGSNNARQRRRRARSDPRMDAGVLHRLAFTIWHTALHIEKENNNEALASQKQPTISSRNSQSAARLTRVMAGAGVGGGGGGGDVERGQGGGGAAGGGGAKMDVVYVTERIISLAFPATLDDATYTLHLREVAHMLSSKHGDNFKVFNLSGQGEVSHFLPRVLELGWAEQLAPALERLCSICKALDSWITQHPQHVAVLHARGGYEKLGVVVAAYMHYSNICASTDQALDRYAMKRFFDDKIGQLYHPSQKRYVQYFAGLLSGVIRINSSPLYLHTLTMYGIPHFEPRGGCHLFIKIYQGMTPIYTSGIYNLTDTMRQVTIVFEMGVQLRGDILLKAYHRRLMPASREVIFRMQFHTCAVSEKILVFTRNDLDDACNDMRFPLDGSVELYFTHSPDEHPRTVSNVSCDKSPCAIASWNSYENINFTFEQVDDQGVAGVGSVSHTLGPLDGSLYATVTKKRQPPPPASPHSPVSPHAPSAHTPSPHGLVNGRYAASIDSGIASSNSAGAAPVSPPTSDTSQTSGESRGTAAAVATGRVGAGGPPPYVDARQLDELLQGMLLEIQNIPDLRPGQTPAPDIDSIRCPDFSMTTKTDTRVGIVSGGAGEAGVHPYTSHLPHSPVNGYSGSTTHDSLLDTSLSTTAEDLPYHARTDSKPFSYGAVTSSPLLGRRRTTSEGGDGVPAPPSPSIHRRNSRETLGQARAGLESPRLVRRMSGSVGGSPGEGSTNTRRSPSPSPSPEPGSRGGTLQRQRSHTLTTRLMSGVESTPNTSLSRSEHTRSASRLDDSFDYSIDPHCRSFSSTSSNNVSWLQMQQRKLAERREAKFRAERGPQEARMLSELRTRMSQQQRTTATGSKEFEDGYVSDTTLLSETSRESSPVKTLPPLTINTGVAPTTPQKPPIGHSTPARGNSAPSSPILPTRSASRERSVRNNAPSNSQRSLPRKQPDMLERERPFVAVKRAHEHAKPSESVDSSAALSQLQTSPHGHINYSSYSSSSPVDGLLTTVVSSSNQEGLDSLDALSATLASLGSPTHPPTSTTSPPNPISSTTTTITTTAVTTSAESQSIHTAQTSQSREESAWQSDTESSFGGTRPITPGFPPATPTTPYLNQGLPPKSPTMQRKEMGVRSPSPATSQTLRQEVNGHSSPAPSLYHGQSRRSSLTSLSESTEVISSHPKFVKDISKFWYKPTITRDDAITMLKDKTPGTFVVRDSNSFPGAFGLALKVSTPPPNVTTKSSDPASELVRHFLIEPTSRGVRLKGCANEPVFGSLSALVYQHSITALALPCRLMLPEKDPAGAADTVDSGASTSSGSSSTTQLLQQGAACNVMYLHSADTESLTGPQAVKRAVSLMLASKIMPTVVHFKVSAQGITLTDNERKLFFRRHYPVNTISHCGLDPDDRRWTHKSEEGAALGSLRVFGFVAKKGASRTENQCHILAELEPEQPATAICNFVTKVMMTSVSRPNLV
ncbi:uncharacterized protein by isoform X4 [Cherax quadricarinatus]